MKKAWDFLDTQRCRNLILLLFLVATFWFVYEFRNQCFIGYAWDGHLHGYYSNKPAEVKLID